MKKIILTAEDIERFWSYVKRGGADECWEWFGCKEPLMGYGMIRIGGRKGQTILCHRISYQIKFGEIPERLCVLHECDNPACQNPKHFKLGTRVQNNKDRDRRGRQVAPKGSDSGNAVFTEAQVKEIKATHMRRHGWVAEKARELGVSRATISHIVNGRNWSHIIP